MADKPLDIFRVLAQLDKKDKDLFEQLTDKEVKSYAPVVVTRWLSGTNNKQQLFLINELVNPYVFSLHHHKQLLWFLSTICTSGRTQRYNWNKTTTGSKNPNVGCINCIREYFKYNTVDAEQVYNTIDKINIIGMAEELGYQDSELNKIKKELGLSTTPTKTKTKKTKSSMGNIIINPDIELDF